eukprot:1126179-Prorocentrum_minimum.AAC.4
MPQAGVVAVGDLLSNDISLQRLNMSWNSVDSPSAVAALCYPLRTHTTLVYLDLSNLGLGEVTAGGGAAVAEVTDMTTFEHAACRNEGASILLFRLLYYYCNRITSFYGSSCADNGKGAPQILL